MPFGLVDRVGPRNRVLDGVHVGATWQIRFNDCVRRQLVSLLPGVSTRPRLKLLLDFLLTVSTNM